MLGISFGEILVIACVVLLITKPEDIPALIKNFKKARKWFRELYSELSSSISSLTDDDDEKNLSSEETEKINFFLLKIQDMGAEYKDEYDLKAVKSYYNKLLAKHSSKKNHSLSQKKKK